MITTQDKRLALKAISVCYMFNLNYQLKCNDLFGCLNRIWNSVNFEQTLEPVEDEASDTSKLRKLLLLLLRETDAERLVRLSGFRELVELRPFIHDDNISRRYLGGPFDPSNGEGLTHDQSLEATLAHQEFISYFHILSENQNAKNKKRFIEKLARLLFVIRSNIAHGSKTHYEGSHRNERICSHTYEVLKHIFNAILDNGLFKIAAYGELKRSGRLFSPLVEQNHGQFVGEATIKGGLVHSSNSIMFDEFSENQEIINLDLLEFKNAQALHNIDVVESMPRSLCELRDGNDKVQFAWIYTRAASITDGRGPISVEEREAQIEEKVRTFHLSLVAIQKKYLGINTQIDAAEQVLFPRLTIQKGFLIRYEGNFKEGEFTHPYSSNFISFIADIDRSYRALFGSKSDQPPFIGRVRGAIWEDLQMNKRFYDNYIEDDLMQVSLKMYKTLIVDMTSSIALWSCHFCGDQDGVLWEQINREMNTDE